jgi:2-aminoadipate transaminase
VRICEHFGVPIVEDDPYGELRFGGAHLPALASLPTSGTIVYSGTGSKIMAPGMRIAWLVTHDREVHEKLVLAKQGADLQSGTLAQYVFAAFVSKREAFERHLATIVQVYGERRDVMHDALREFMPDSVSFNHPEGGMFMWAKASGIDTTELLAISTKQRVAFVPGVSFYPKRDVTDGMRLNFSHSTPEKIRIGIERLATAIRSMQ